MKEDKIRVLLLVSEAWRADVSGGNTINNFFEGMQGVEFAQIYCDNRLPDNNVCSRYFQISQSEVVRNFILHKPVGKKLDVSNVEAVACDENVVNPKRNKLWERTVSARPLLLVTIKRLLWSLSNWKTPALRKFISDFDPDVIYAPCYAFPFQLALTRYVKTFTGCKVITWSADDSYSLRQFSLNPLFWLMRFHTRRCLKKTYPYYDEFYSISEDEILEMSPIVGRQMKLLRKGVHIPETFSPREPHRPIRFIYAGGLYLNRYKCLIKIADALRAINRDSVKAELHIYTGSKLNGKNSALLNDNRSVYYHGLISGEELSDIYQNSDVAIHCESFELAYRLATRLSFSTKIIDCFQSGCAILAIAWKEHTALKYLKKEDAALCVTDIDDISQTIEFIVNNPTIIQEYSMKAYQCEKRNHQIEDIQKMLYDSFAELSKTK